MVYWYTEFPAQPSEIFSYSEAQYRADEQYLAQLTEEINSHDAGAFELTSDERQCNYCAYRSFCDRGDIAGAFEKRDDEPGVDVDEGPLLANLDDYESIVF